MGILPVEASRAGAVQSGAEEDGEPEDVCDKAVVFAAGWAHLEIEEGEAADNWKDAPWIIINYLKDAI